MFYLSGGKVERRTLDAQLNSIGVRNFDLKDFYARSRWLMQTGEYLLTRTSEPLSEKINLSRYYGTNVLERLRESGVWGQRLVNALVYGGGLLSTAASGIFFWFYAPTLARAAIVQPPVVTRRPPTAPLPPDYQDRLLAALQASWLWILTGLTKL